MRLGRAMLKWVGIAALLAAGYWRLYTSAKADVEAKRVAEDLNALKDKEALNGKFRKVGDADLDRELARWVRE
jgi:hypothetical protein